MDKKPDAKSFEHCTGLKNQEFKYKYLISIIQINIHNITTIIRLQKKVLV
jgi:hypothetical protein